MDEGQLVGDTGVRMESAGAGRQVGSQQSRGHGSLAVARCGTVSRARTPPEGVQIRALASGCWTVKSGLSWKFAHVTDIGRRRVPQHKHGCSRWRYLRRVEQCGKTSAQLQRMFDWQELFGMLVEADVELWDQALADIDWVLFLTRNSPKSSTTWCVLRSVLSRFVYAIFNLAAPSGDERA